MTPRTAIIALCLLGAGFDESSARAAGPDLDTFATGLLGPSKIIRTPRGAFLVAETGPEEPNNGRVSIVDSDGGRHTLLDGLPSARTFVGDFNGTTALHLRGRTLFVLNGQGDVTVPGPVPGTEAANPTPASPIFSSVLAVHFSAAVERTTTGVRLTLADHHALKAGETLALSDAEGGELTVRLVADFEDYLPEPRPSFAANVRHSHPYGLVGRDRLLHIIDAGLNAIRTVDLVSGEEETLATFPPTPSPLPFGPPVIENVPTSIRWAGRDLLVTLLSGAPAFLPGYSQVQRVDPRSGAVAPLIAGLSSAIDVLPLPDKSSERILTLEFNLTFPVPGPGRLQLFGSDGESAVLSDRLTTPSSMVLDGKGGRLVIAELATGRLVTLELP